MGKILSQNVTTLPYLLAISLAEVSHDFTKARD